MPDAFLLREFECLYRQLRQLSEKQSTDLRYIVLVAYLQLLQSIPDLRMNPILHPVIAYAFETPFTIITLS